jgi:hypothetical protein
MKAYLEDIVLAAFVKVSRMGPAISELGCIGTAGIGSRRRGRRIRTDEMG